MTGTRPDGLLVGLHLIAPPARVAEIARAAEAAGCDSVWVGDHLVWADGAHGYPYSDDGSPPVPDDTPFFDPWVLLAAVATATSRIALGTYVYVLPLRHPLVTAKAVATLDTLAGGRTILGAGIGWLREEFEAAGAGFADRAARAAEIVEVLRIAWGERVVAYEGRAVRLRPVRVEPKPPQGAALPIHFGGESQAALARAAQLGDGWLGMPHTPESAAARVRSLRALRAAARRDAPFQVTVAAPRWPLAVDELAAYEAAGVDRLIVRPWRRSREWAEGIEQLAGLLEEHRRG